MPANNFLPSHRWDVAARKPRGCDVAVRRRLGVITPSGIVEDWYGDGNTIRTALMYVLWRTQGARFAPWDRRVHLGAELIAGLPVSVRAGETLVISVTAGGPPPYGK